MNDKRRFKYGIFLHPELSEPSTAAWLFTDELVASHRDELNPELGRVDVKWSFVIESWQGEVYFRVDHQPEKRQFFADDLSGPVRQGIEQALDWWNGETLLICPQGKELVWNGPELPNAWNHSWQGDLVVQNITQYPKRLGQRVLQEWNPGLLYLPFEFVYHAPTPDQERAAIRAWAETQLAELRAALGALAVPAEAPWHFTTAKHYRAGIMPDPTRLIPVGTLEQAEAYAEDYRGLCFLVNGATGEYTSRWAER